MERQYNVQSEFPRGAAFTSPTGIQQSERSPVATKLPEEPPETVLAEQPARCCQVADPVRAREVGL
jgi:hypothetical protein